MRYFRMYVLVNVIMSGVMRAAEAPQEVLHDASALSMEDEPPQEKVSDNTESPSLPVQTVEDVNKEGSAALVPVSPESQPLEMVTVEKAGDAREKVEEPVTQEPTLEDAEKLIEEPLVVAPTDVSSSAIPLQPGIMPGALPVEPATHSVTPISEEVTAGKEVHGIDTVDLEQPQGNWLFKRYWWERAEEIYKKIRMHVEKINDIRVKFFARRTELDKTILDPFYTDIGLTQSELQTATQSLMSKLEQERKEDGMLSEEEREIMDAVQKDRERLEQLQRDVRGVGALRDTADKVIDRVIDQKKRVSTHESEAWESMREIGRIVSDTQASELYYRMDAGWRTVKDVYRYVDQDLSRFFDKLLVNAKEQTERIKTALQALKEQGVDLKERMQQAQEHEIQQDKDVEGREKEKKPVATQKTGWFASTSRIFQAVIDVAIWQFLQSIWDVLMWLPRRIYTTFTSLFR